MAISSEFHIIRKTSNKFNEKEFLEFKSCYKSLIDNKLVEDLPEFISYFDENTKNEEFKKYGFYNVKDKSKWITLLSCHFISSFSSLLDKYNLTPYTYSGSLREFSVIEVKNMLIAIKYLLSKKYSKEFEEIISNEYLEYFGKLIPLWTYQREDDQELKEEDLEGTYILNSLKTIFEAFLMCKDHEDEKYEVKLIYTCCG